jgi:hypothetical protein
MLTAGNVRWCVVRAFPLDSPVPSGRQVLVSLYTLLLLLDAGHVIVIVWNTAMCCSAYVEMHAFLRIRSQLSQA